MLRERPTGQRQTPPKTPPPAAPVKKIAVYEWIVAFKYDRTGKSFDVITTAVDETQAYDIAIGFLAADPSGKKILTPTLRLKKGWQGVPVRANATSESVGEAEYREDSDDES